MLTNSFIGNAEEYCVVCSMLENDPNKSMIEMVYKQHETTVFFSSVCEVKCLFLQSFFGL